MIRWRHLRRSAATTFLRLWLYTKGCDFCRMVRLSAVAWCDSRRRPTRRAGLRVLDGHNLWDIRTGVRPSLDQGTGLPGPECCGPVNMSVGCQRSQLPSPRPTGVPSQDGQSAQPGDGVTRSVTECCDHYVAESLLGAVASGQAALWYARDDQGSPDVGAVACRVAVPDGSVLLPG